MKIYKITEKEKYYPGTEFEKLFYEVFGKKLYGDSIINKDPNKSFYEIKIILQNSVNSRTYTEYHKLFEFLEQFQHNELFFYLLYSQSYGYYIKIELYDLNLIIDKLKLLASSNKFNL